MYNQRYLGIKGALEGEKDEKAAMLRMPRALQTMNCLVVEGNDVQLRNT